ncbi:precorrin-6A reductase [Candidatus Enterococcus murrayae]|uniref:Precorrin-6A reductase n=1 Tax=Candidatus Enterococcus murrayae TaxID=2815321 RepID=A0ABS3HFC4_9ENTE|nr:precorrin-6A reductase [Enterococcus sp. MJM16]MBO0452143.1 precorrin-6A reductase [Enterococcus sp. MJM16]
MILLLGGTSESLKIAEALNECDIRFYLSVVTDYGENLAKSVAEHIIKGRLTRTEMISFILNHKIDLVIDATHPYAVEVSKNAIAACFDTEINYYRFERPSYHAEEMVSVDSIKAACQKALENSGNIYLTTGSKTLGEFLKYLPKERIIARVLPTADVLMTIEKFGLSTAQIEAIKGPFSKSLNRELLIHNRAGVMITKESGQAGGFLEKVQACNELNIPCIVLEREQIEYPNKFSSIEELIDRIKG